MLLKQIGFALVLLTSQVANAIELDIVKNFGHRNKMDASMQIGSMSYHFDSNSHKYLNETNPSIGVELWDISVVYVHKNSWNENSVFVSYSPDIIETHSFVLSGQIGLATGYNSNQYVVKDNGAKHKNGIMTVFGFAPFVGLTGKVFVSNNTTVNLTVTPNVATLATEFRF